MESQSLTTKKSSTIVEIMPQTKQMGEIVLFLKKKKKEHMSMRGLQPARQSRGISLRSRKDFHIV